MPRRKQKPRTNSGLIRHLEPLYTSNLLKYLAWAEEYRLLSVLIYGPHYGLHHGETIHVHDKRYGDSRYPATQYRIDVVQHVEERLRALWFDLREQIFEAQQRYAPDQEPWGARFDQ